MRTDEKMTKRGVVVALVLALSVAGWARAGSLDPTHAPGPTMKSLQEIWDATQTVGSQVAGVSSQVTAAQSQLLGLSNGLLEVKGAVAANQQQEADVLQQVAGLQQVVADLRQRMASAGMQASFGDMVLIPAGSFAMGACTNVGQESIGDAIPQHTVYVSAFYMDKYEVASNLWTDIYVWATNNGYAMSVGLFKAPGHPVQNVNWYESLAWCNARSQRDGFAPCYTNANGSVYTNSVSAFYGDCNWNADGYRLPTEAEWEKAARGGVANMRFPWADAQTIRHGRANYQADPASHFFDTSSTSGYHPTYATGDVPYTSPAGAFAPNGHGLYDMAGNVWEWCWDWYGSTYNSGSSGNDPRGAASGSDRVIRGGCWGSLAGNCRSAYRNCFAPYNPSDSVGFRAVRTLP